MYSNGHCASFARYWFRMDFLRLHFTFAFHFLRVLMGSYIFITSLMTMRSVLSSLNFSPLFKLKKKCRFLNVVSFAMLKCKIDWHWLRLVIVEVFLAHFFAPWIFHVLSTSFSLGANRRLFTTISKDYFIKNSCLKLNVKIFAQESNTEASTRLCWTLLWIYVKWILCTIVYIDNELLDL